MMTEASLTNLHSMSRQGILKDSTQKNQVSSEEMFICTLDFLMEQFFRVDMIVSNKYIQSDIVEIKTIQAKKTHLQAPTVLTTSATNRKHQQPSPSQVTKQCEDEAVTIPALGLFSLLMLSEEISHQETVR